MLVTLHIAKALCKCYLKNVTVYKELNVLLNAIIVEAMAQIYCNQINEVQHFKHFSSLVKINYL